MSSPTDGPTGSTRDVETIERELRRLLTRARSYAVDVARAVHPDLDPAVYSLLVEIAEHPPTRAVDLAEERGITKGVVSRQVGTLERLGLIGREPDPTDARAHILLPTAAGKRAVRRSQQARRAAIERLLSGCTPDELAGIAAALSRFNELME